MQLGNVESAARNIQAKRTVGCHNKCIAKTTVTELLIGMHWHIPIVEWMHQTVLHGSSRENIWCVTWVTYDWNTSAGEFKSGERLTWTSTWDYRTSSSTYNDRTDPSPSKYCAAPLPRFVDWCFTVLKKSEGKFDWAAGLLENDIRLVRRMAKLLSYESGGLFSATLYHLYILSGVQCRPNTFCIPRVYGHRSLSQARGTARVASLHVGSVKRLIRW